MAQRSVEKAVTRTRSVWSGCHGRMSFYKYLFALKKVSQWVSCVEQMFSGILISLLCSPCIFVLYAYMANGLSCLEYVAYQEHRRDLTGLNSNNTFEILSH